MSWLEQWVVSSVIGLVVVLADSWLLYAGTYSRSFGFSTSIAIMGIVTFFGMITISSFVQQARDARRNVQRRLSKLGATGDDGASWERADFGVLRDALTGSLTALYLMVVALAATGRISEGPTISQFSELMMVVVAFYFTERAIEHAYGNKSGADSSSTGSSSGQVPSTSSVANPAPGPTSKS